MCGLGEAHSTTDRTRDSTASKSSTQKPVARKNPSLCRLAWIFRCVAIVHTRRRGGDHARLRFLGEYTYTARVVRVIKLASSYTYG